MSRQTMFWTMIVGFLQSLGLSLIHGQLWEPLLHDSTLANWQQVDGQPAGAGWELTDSTLHLKQGDVRGGNLLTREAYGDFELVFEWKIAARGNNGVKYRVRDYDNRTLGIEYQLIDDKDYGGLRTEQTTGSVYDLFEPTEPKPLRPVGEFNRSAIVVRDQHLEHFLNGRLIAEVNIGGDLWRQRVAASKFRDADRFGENEIGRLMLTDHNSEVWFRNMFIRRLSGTSDAGNDSARSGITSNATSCSMPCHAPSCRFDVPRVCASNEIVDANDCEHTDHVRVRSSCHVSCHVCGIKLRLRRCCH